MRCVRRRCFSFSSFSDWVSSAAGEMEHEVGSSSGVWCCTATSSALTGCANECSSCMAIVDRPFASSWLFSVSDKRRGEEGGSKVGSVSSFNGSFP